MKKIVLLLFFLLVSLSASVNAMTINDGGIIYYAGSQYTNSNVQYETQSFTFTLKSPSYGTFDVTFPASEVFPGDYIIVTADQFSQALSAIGAPYTYAQLYATGNLRIVGNATIWIWAGGVHAATITSKGDVDSIAKNVFGFQEPDLTDMKDRFNFGFTPPAPPVPINNPSTNNINFYLSIEDPDKIDSTNWSRSAVTYTKSKSGYGIPLVAEIRGFNYVPHVTAQGQMSYYTNFRIQDDSSVYISSTSLDKIPQTNFDYITNKINGYDEYRRYFLPVNTNSPLNMRKIYSSVNQQNGTYSLTVTAHAHTTWDEWTYEWWYNTGYPDYIDVYHWVDTPQNTWYDSSQSVTIDIQGSMFDDDSQTIINNP